ncbi:glycoside hydrolase family 9 protein, partial [Vulcanococcus sp.]|uniref:glycoside hydrolase family 9 protein n=1 Tax=Vulcanococcus sp. TaxID=2856995 RepID=UPI003F6982BD
MNSNLEISVGGQRWWNGFTAEITITNASSESLTGWSYSFTSPHQIEGLPWGARVASETLADGQIRYTLSGTGWGETIPAGGSITVGFNASQGTPIGQAGPLTAALLGGNARTTLQGSLIEAAPPQPAMPHANDSPYRPITAWGSFQSSSHTGHEGLMGGRTPITTEALQAYNALRAFQELPTASLEEVGRWAFANGLTNNAEPAGNDLQGVGLWYAMQGAKVGWIDDRHFSAALIADLERTARLGTPEAVMQLVVDHALQGFSSFLTSTGERDAFINTLKMEPHYGGWMHARTQGGLALSHGATAHDVNHLTVLSHDQSQAFMNDTFDYPQWPALDVPAGEVIDYFQSMVSLSAPLMTPPTALVNEPPPSQARQQEALLVSVDGNRWWNGFTAELTITNTSAATVDGWSISFDSAHSMSGDAWGANVQSNDLGNGLTRFTLSGQGWASTIPAGGSITVGFNGNQGRRIGNEGSLTAALLFDTEPVAAAPEITPTPITPAANQPTTSGGADYGNALGLSLLFYDAQRSGNLDDASNRISWRSNSGLRDGLDGVYFGGESPQNLQAGLNLDLTGGYHDAGDHVKFGLPLASTLSTLAWGGIQFQEGYQAAGQLDQLLSTVRWGTDYLLKAHGSDADGSTTYFVAQVGNATDDHNLWSAPESQTIPRPAMAVTPEVPGSDVAAASAAAMASASVLFRQNGDAAYANELFKHAESLYRFADTYRGRYSDSIPEVQAFYNSWSGYEDELAYGAAWLNRAAEAAGDDGQAYEDAAINLYRTSLAGLSPGWTHNWDDASYATGVLLAKDSDDTAILQDVQQWLDSWVNGTNGVQITEGGLPFISDWGSLRYAANTAILAGVVADEPINPNGSYSELATNIVDYILGDNPRKASYLVGYGE